MARETMVFTRSSQLLRSSFQSTTRTYSGPSPLSEASMNFITVRPVLGVGPASLDTPVAWNTEGNHSQDLRSVAPRGTDTAGRAGANSPPRTEEDTPETQHTPK